MSLTPHCISAFAHFAPNHSCKIPDGYALCIDIQSTDPPIQWSTRIFVRGKHICTYRSERTAPWTSNSHLRRRIDCSDDTVHLKTYMHAT
jgi:hypothetical protein